MQKAVDCKGKRYTRIVVNSQKGTCFLNEALVTFELFISKKKSLFSMHVLSYDVLSCTNNDMKAVETVFCFTMLCVCHLRDFPFSGRLVLRYPHPRNEGMYK